MAEKRKINRVIDTAGNIVQIYPQTSADNVIVDNSHGIFSSTDVQSVLEELADIASTGGVTQVNGKTGNVTLTAEDVGAEERGAVSTHNSATDAHGGHFTNTNNPHSVTKSQVGLGNVTNDAQVKRSEMGVASGVATLDAEGRVPSSQLPSYVDDVLEYPNKASFPSTGEEGKIYVAKDTNLTYRWGGTSYVIISPSLALGETSSTAYAGDKGKTNADNITNILNGTTKVGVASLADEATNADNATHANEATHATSADTADSATNATSATKLSSSKTFALTGDITGSLVSDLSTNVSIATKIGAGKVGTTELSDNAVLTAKIKDGNVTNAKLADSGVVAGAYSAVSVNSKGIVTTGGTAIEFGTSGQTEPSVNLMVGGLFFELQ